MLLNFVLIFYITAIFKASEFVVVVSIGVRANIDFSDASPFEIFE